MRPFVTLLALWALVVPTLCLAGAFGHACGSCDDCGNEIACTHEEECLGDPCTEEIIRPASRVGVPATLPFATVAAPLPPVRVASAPTVRPISRQFPSPLPLPESDLPLLI